MRKILLAGLAFGLASSGALACDDHVGKCKVEDWKHTYTGMMKALQIDGVATCDKGRIVLRLYDGSGDDRKFVGIETAFIEGHAFQAIKLQVAAPRELSIKYSINPE